MNTLNNFLKAIADEIRRIKNKSNPIVANDFVTELSEIGNEPIIFDNGMGYKVNKNLIYSGLHNTPDSRIKVQMVKYQCYDDNPNNVDGTLRFYNLTDEEIKGDEHTYDDGTVHYSKNFNVKYYNKNGVLVKTGFVFYETIPANGYYDCRFAEGYYSFPEYYSYEVVEYDE